MSTDPGAQLEPNVERDLRVIVNGWLAFTFEMCRQRIIDPSTNADRLADACAHALLDAIARVPDIPRRAVRRRSRRSGRNRRRDRPVLFVGAGWHDG